MHNGNGNALMVAAVDGANQILGDFPFSFRLPYDSSMEKLSHNFPQCVFKNQNLTFNLMLPAF